MMDFSEIKDFFALHCVRLALKTFWIFPIKKNKIFFSSYEGKQFSCNPKRIFQYLYNQKKISLKYVYEYNDLTNKPEELMQSDVVTVTHNSFKYVYELLTSKVIVCNSGITPKIPLRKQQIQINTWHGGGAYKKGGLDLEKSINYAGKVLITTSAKQTSYFVSSCSAFTKAMQSALGIQKEKFLTYGMPRNDIFFDSKAMKRIQEKVKESLGIPLHKQIVLYAPTYRGKVRSVEDDPLKHFCFNQVLDTLKIKFGGEWLALYRGHYFYKGPVQKSNFMDVSTYPDMQDLLCIADVLITDYSSSIWDYSFSNKPGFLYTPDLEEYKKSFDFYTPVVSWPFPYATSIQGLCTLIYDYDAVQQNKRNEYHHKSLHSYERGTATQTISKFILSKL